MLGVGFLLIFIWAIDIRFQREREIENPTKVILSTNAPNPRTKEPPNQRPKPKMHEFSAQQKALAIIPHVTGFLSLMGSCSILYDILSDRKKKLKRPYYRILLGMSFADAITSIWIGLSTWPIPEGTPGVYGAVGNTQTCTVQGFFVQLIVLSPCYNLNLSLYYLLMGTYHMTEDQIAKRFERYMHAGAIIIGFGFAILGLPLTLYNNANLWCWISSYPSNCEDPSGNPGPVPCERGANAWLFRWLIFYGPIWLIILTITTMLIILTRSVRREEKRIIEIQKQIRADSMSFANQFEMEEMPVTDVDDPPTVPTTKNGEDVNENQQERQQPRAITTTPMAMLETHRFERSRQIFHQAVFYCVVFYISWLFVTINRMYQLITGESIYSLLVLHSIFGPLQGFLNFIVYRHGQITA